MKYYLYWIKHPEHTDITSEGYVGISKNPTGRWKAHIKATNNTHLKNAVKKYGWDTLDKTVVLCSTQDYCKEIEQKLRPQTNVGWNIAVGGGNPDPLTGKIRITNGVVEKAIDRNAVIPDGWHRGRSNKAKEKLAKYSGECHSRWGKQISDETKQKLREQKLGDKNPMKNPKNAAKMAASLMGRTPWNKGISTGPNPEHSKRMMGRTPWNKGKTTKHI